MATPLAFRAVRCISTDDHQPLSLGEHVLHYFACIEIRDRPSYLSQQHPAWQYEAGVERKKLERAGHDDANLEAEIQRRINSKITELATEVLRRYRRIDTIRAAIQEDRTNSGPNPIPTAALDLISCVTESHVSWKISAEFQRNIDNVREWRRQRTPSDVSKEADDEMAALRSWVPTGGEDQARAQLERYDVEKDVQVHIMQFDKPQSDNDGGPLSLDSDPTGQRRCSVENLFQEPEGSNLSHSDKIRYVHFPYNNPKAS